MPSPKVLQASDLAVGQKKFLFILSLIHLFIFFGFLCFRFISCLKRSCTLFYVTGGQVPPAYAEHLRKFWVNSKSVIPLGCRRRRSGAPCTRRASSYVHETQRWNICGTLWVKRGLKLEGKRDMAPVPFYRRWLFSHFRVGTNKTPEQEGRNCPPCLIPLACNGIWIVPDVRNCVAELALIHIFFGDVVMQLWHTFLTYTNDTQKLWPQIWWNKCGK